MAVKVTVQIINPWIRYQPRLTAVRVTVQIIDTSKIISTEALAEVYIIFQGLITLTAMCYLFYYTEQNCNM